MVRDVFVSYSQPDYAYAMELVNWVEQEGVNCWIAPRDIAPAADWAAEIVDAIANSRVMVLVFSANSNESPQVRREVERAVHKQISILPFRIENVLPSKSLEYFLSAQHWMDAFTAPREPHYARLCAYLRAQRGGAASADTARTELLNGGEFAPAEVLRIERLLAGYIGPIAKHLVKTAASQSASVEDLVGRVATELESETDRHEFMQRWRTGAPRKG